MVVFCVPIYQIVGMRALEGEEVSELHLIQRLWLFLSNNVGEDSDGMVIKVVCGIKSTETTNEDPRVP